MIFTHVVSDEYYFGSDNLRQGLGGADLNPSLCLLMYFHGYIIRRLFIIFFFQEQGERPGNH